MQYNIVHEYHQNPIQLTHVWSFSTRTGGKVEFVVVMEESSACIDFEFKVITVGDSGVGKTSLLLRYTESVFNDTITTLTHLEFTQKTLSCAGYKVKLKMIDTSGEEKFGMLNSQYCRQGDAMLLCYDVSNKDSFIHVNYWRQKIGVSFNKPVILVGNKVDLTKDKTVISATDGESTAHNLCTGGVPFFEVSAKTGHGVDALFEKLVSLLIRRTREAVMIGRASIVLSHDVSEDRTQRKCCCCCF